MKTRDIQLRAIQPPHSFRDVPPVTLTDATLLERKTKLLERMQEERFDALVIYADKEPACKNDDFDPGADRTYRFTAQYLLRRTPL